MTESLEPQMEHTLETLRSDYTQGTLEVVSTDPWQQLEHWLRDALEARLTEPHAMTLCTVAEDGRPSSRVVLLRGWEAGGLKFYSNYLSHKGRDLAHNPQACLNFWWGPLERQIRIEGRVERLSAGESDAYFHSRPRDSQLASSVSPQSSPIASRAELEARIEALERQYPGDLPRPEHWGGYRLIPDLFEFWQGRPARLHDRFQFTLEPLTSGTEAETWKLERLAP